MTELELVESVAEAAEGGGFGANATWNGSGSISNWGHVHQRRNRYHAELQVTRSTEPGS